MQSRPEYSVITNQTLHKFFVNTSNVSVGVSVFKLSVQSVCQLQQHTISYEMTGLPYHWTPVANHSLSTARQSSARQCWSVWRV